MKSALDGARRKLIRAQIHLDAVTDTLVRFADGECAIVPETETDDGLILRVRLPKVPDTLAPTIGDFLFNVRSALDHIVWQLVLSNPPNEPTSRNAFPICTSDENFRTALAGHRLDGVPAQAAIIIKNLQPYIGGQNPLATLNDLHNVDKHRQLSLVTAVSSETTLDWFRGGEVVCRIVLGGHELREGTRLGDMAVSVAGGGTISARLADVKVQGKAALFVAFTDEKAETLEPFRVETVLEEILQFVRDEVFTAFESFF
jgi:hypothetical protein